MGAKLDAESQGLKLAIFIRDQIHPHLAVDLANQAGPFEHIHIIRGDNTTLARAHGLAALKTPYACMSNTSHGGAVVRCAVRMRAILNDFDTRLLTQFHDCVHITYMAPQVNEDNGLGAFGDLTPSIFYVDQQGFGINFTEDRPCHEHEGWRN